MNKDLKIYIREILKNADKNNIYGGVYKNDLSFELSKMDLVFSDEEFNEKLQQMFKDGEIYESKPNFIKWLE